jgi:iron-sulfur cluster insertion protein
MTQESITFTDAAANRVKDLIKNEGNDNLKLRVYVTGGGCSGFQYGFSFDEAADEGDFSFEHNGVTILVDHMSMQYMDGVSIDFYSGLDGERFVISNPNATTTCGCGSSFSV